jgi:hypothetical protein
VRRCASVFVGVRRCALVCIGVRLCASVCIGARRRRVDVVSMCRADPTSVPAGDCPRRCGCSSTDCPSRSSAAFSGAERTCFSPRRLCYLRALWIMVMESIKSREYARRTMHGGRSAVGVVLGVTAVKVEIIMSSVRHLCLDRRAHVVHDDHVLGPASSHTTRRR